MNRGWLNLVRYSVKCAMVEPHGPCCTLPILRCVVHNTTLSDKVYQSRLPLGLFV